MKEIYDGQEVNAKTDGGYNADVGNGAFMKLETLMLADGTQRERRTFADITLPAGVTFARGDNPLVKHILGVSALPAGAETRARVTPGTGAGNAAEAERGADGADGMPSYTLYAPPPGAAEEITLYCDDAPLLHVLTAALPAGWARVQIAVAREEEL
jgi:hypothetical protein